VSVTIENPIINSPFVEPARHFVMDADGKVTGEVAPRRRPSEFFVPVARPKKLSAQLSMDQFADIESLLRDAEAVLRRRAFQFANVERTNNLMDLVVARQNGMFTDLTAIAQLIEADEMPHRGWAVPMRAIDDPQPRNDRYSSLRDESRDARRRSSARPAMSRLWGDPGNLRLVVLDVETCVAPDKAHRVVSVGVAVVRGDTVQDRREVFVNPGCDIDPFTTEHVHHIKTEHVADEPPLNELWPEVARFFTGRKGETVVLSAHRPGFDIPVLRNDRWPRTGGDPLPDLPVIDTLLAGMPESLPPADSLPRAGPVPRLPGRATLPARCMARRTCAPRHHRDGVHHHDLLEPRVGECRCQAEHEGRGARLGRDAPHLLAARRTGRCAPAWTGGTPTSPPPSSVSRTRSGPPAAATRGSPRSVSFRRAGPDARPTCERRSRTQPWC